MKEDKILIIKFGGLGDVVLSLDAMYSIKKNFNKSKLILLTEKPYDDILRKSGWFDKIVLIKRSLFYFLDIFQIKKKIDVTSLSKVFDLQTSKRSSSYLRIFAKSGVYTNGIGKFATICHSNPNRNFLHTSDRQKEQLKLSKIDIKENAKLNWLYPRIKNNKTRFALIVPGGSLKRKYKRIPLEVYSNIIEFLLAKKIKPVLIGSVDDQQICQTLKKKFLTLDNLCNKTDFFKIAELSKQSIISVGNDTGPMHLISRGNNPTIVFFTKFSDSKLCAPLGKNVSIVKYSCNNLVFGKTVIEQIQRLIINQ